MKIDNDEVWADIKDGKYLGLSIEGRFSEKEAELSEVEQEEELLNKIIEILKN
jgi:hypothetical protein